MAKTDDGFKQSEKMLNELEAKIHKEYAQAKKEMGEKVDAYFAKFEKQNVKMEQAVRQGRMSVKEYNDWRMRKMATGKQYIAMRNTLAKDLTNTDKIAMKIVNQSLPDVYALNMNYGTYSIEKDSKINTSFTLYNHAAVERLIKDNPKLLPSPKVDIPKDLRWNQQHIQSAITQGILQGKSIPKIAKDLQRVTGMDENAAIRNARTAMTGAQNAGRLDSMKRAAARGIGVKKGWLSTLDNVTRDSHVDLDGEVQEIDRPFSNGLMYPGDASGIPAEVYNCFIPETKIGVDSKIIRSYKHRYEGEIISIKSALGVNLSCTPNHPILTDRGWVAAKFLNEGDNLIVTSCIDNEVSRRNPNINHAFPRIDTIHQLFDIFGGKRTSDLRVNFHGDIPTSEVEIITQKRFLWSDVYTCIRKCINKFLFKDTNISFLCKCSFVEHFRRIMRTTFGNVSGVCKSFSFFLRSMEHSDIHGLRAITDGNVVFGKDTLNDLPTNVVLPSEIKNGLARKVFLDNIVSVERSDFVGHVYNLQTDNNYYFVNSSITNNNAHCNGIMAIAHNCRCRLTHEYDKYKTDWSNPANRNTEKLGNMSYDEWKNKHKGKVTKIVAKAAAQKVVTPIEHSKEYQTIVDRITKGYNIEYREVEDLQEPLTEEQIIEKIGGGDLTKGSCSSLSYCYIGDKCGYDVNDFRGGDSQEFFSMRSNEKVINSLDGVEKQTFIVNKEASDIAKKLKELDLPYGKEYRLMCGKHAAIIRNTENGYEYLELQSPTRNGWKSFTEKERLKVKGITDGKFEYETIKEKCSMADTLKNRFGCRVSKSNSPIWDEASGGALRDENGILILGSEMELTAVDSYKGNAEFKGILGYINTAPDKQRKGDKGYAK